MNMPFMPSSANIKDPEAKRWAEELAKSLDKYHSDVNNVLRFRTLKIGNPDPGVADYISINEGGDLVFVGGAGLSFGSMFNHDAPTPVTIDEIGVAARVPSGFTAGQTHLTTFQNSREIVITNPGRYICTWQISFTMVSGANQEIEGFFMIDNVMETEGSAHRRITTGTDTGSMSGTAILDLAVGAVVSLGVLNESSTNNVAIEHANMSMVQAGGT